MNESLYEELADWWPVMSAPEDYAEEAAQYADLLGSFGPVRDVLELGAGGGHNALHMKSRFELTLVDRSPAMLAQSRQLNPECRHVAGDMREVRLTRVYDAVFIHDAISYLLTPLDLALTLANARSHCRAGGVVLLAPDDFSETFSPGVSQGGGDRDGRSLRYIEWSHPAEAGATSVRVDYALMLREGDGPVRLVHDVHRCGLFPRAYWLDACLAADLEPHLRSVRHSAPEPATTEVVLCRAV